MSFVNIKRLHRWNYNVIIKLDVYKNTTTTTLKNMRRRWILRILNVKRFCHVKMYSRKQPKLRTRKTTPGNLMMK